MTTPDHRTRTPVRPVHRRHGHAVLTAVLAALFLGSLGNAPVSHASGTPSPPAAAECPPRLASTARCWTGQDDNGAHWTMAVPADRNGSLVVHAHGGPGLGDTSDPERSTGDLERFAVTVEEGYAWALRLPPGRLRHPHGRRRHGERPPPLHRALRLARAHLPPRPVLGRQRRREDRRDLRHQARRLRRRPPDQRRPRRRLTRLRPPRRPARRLPVLLPQPPPPHRTPVPPVEGPARRSP
ncbi:hypothetical protein ACFQVA_01460 [Actinomadura keratinilytica]